MAKARNRDPEELEYTAQQIMEALEDPSQAYRYQSLYDENPVSFVAAERRLMDKRRNPEPTAPSLPSVSERRGSDLAYPELVQEASKLLARDRQKIANSNLPTYQGEKVSPLSGFTQKARELQSLYAGKGAPFQNKVQKIEQRNQNAGFSANQSQAILDMLKSGTTGFHNNVVDKRLKKNFGDSYNYIGNRVNTKHAKDLNASLRDATTNLGNFNKDVAQGADQEYNQKIIELLRNLGGAKQLRREDLQKILEDFGNQRHAYNNMGIEAKRQAFDREATEPARKAAMLEQLLQSTGNADNLHPDVASARASELLNGLRAYGVDPTKITSQWDRTASAPQYQGQRVAGVNPALGRSYSQLDMVGPKTRDVNYDQTKGQVNSLLSQGNLSQQVFDRLPEVLRTSFGEKEKEFKHNLKQELGRLNNYYITRGQAYGGSHMKEAADLTRKYEQTLAKEREQILRAGLGQQFDTGAAAGRRNITSAAQSAQGGIEDNRNMMNQIRGTNKIGQSIFSNQQNDLDRQYNEFQNEDAARWPQNKISALFGGAGVRDQGGIRLGAQQYQQPPLNRNNIAANEEVREVIPPQNQIKNIANNSQQVRQTPIDNSWFFDKPVVQSQPVAQRSPIQVIKPKSQQLQQAQQPVYDVNNRTFKQLIQDTDLYPENKAAIIARMKYLNSIGQGANSGDSYKAPGFGVSSNGQHLRGFR